MWLISTRLQADDRRQLGWLLAIIAFSIALRWQIVSIPLERDEGAYAYIAQRWLAGDLPYRDAFDQKPPGVYLAYAAILSAGFRSIEGIHWLGHSALVGAIVFIYSIGRRLWSHCVGCIAAVATVVLVMDSAVLGNAANTELFAIFPLSACMYCCLRAAEEGRARHSGFAGLTGGIALLFKQVCLPIVVLQLVWLVIVRVRIRQRSPDVASGGRMLVGLVSSFVLGAAVVLAAPCIYFAVKGAWSAFVDGVIGHNLSYSARLPLHAYGANLMRASGPILKSEVTLWLCAGIAVALLARSSLASAEPASSKTNAHPRPEYLGLCAAWWVGSMVAVSVGGYYREHYFILLMPATALLAAAGVVLVSCFFEDLGLYSQGTITLVITLLAIARPIASESQYYAARDPVEVSRRLYGPNPFAESPAVARVLRESSTPEDRVFVYGSEPQLLFYADRISATRYIYVYPLLTGDREARARQREVFDELRHRPPKLIVVVGRPMSFLAHPLTPTVLKDGLTQMLDRSYRPIAQTVVGMDGNFRLLRDGTAAIDEHFNSKIEDASLVVWSRRE